jgi:hypothetical protein
LLRNDVTGKRYAGATLVGFYGPKPGDFRDWLAALQAQILGLLPAFAPRSMDQIHATVIGLEFPLRAVTTDDVLGLAQHLVRTLEHPIDLQFGGYQRGSSAFDSRGLDPYERSFALRGGQAILIGWPFPPTQVLADMRQDAEAFGFRHRYHESGGPLDPDCYLVVGEYAADPPPGVENRIREHLARNPVHARLTADDISVIRYRSTTLDPAGSEQIRLPDGLRAAVAEQIANETRLS